MKRFICVCLWAVSLCVLIQTKVANSQTVTIREINPTHSNIDSTGGRVNRLGRATNSILYAASEFGGLFKSMDAGRSWARLDAHLPTRMSSVKASPANPNLVIATSIYDGRVNSFAGINISRDGGATWTKPASATPPAGFCANPPNRNEPSAFGIAFDAENPAHVFVGTNCGLAKSTDGGLNWTFINPKPDAGAVTVVDVVVHHGGIIDTCGFAGHLRSTDGGVRWAGAQSGGTPLPAGVCSLAPSPDESSVLFATVGLRIFETDNGGASWTTEFTNPSQVDRVPFVATNKRQGNNFDLWFGNKKLFRASCTTPATPAPGARCPPSSTWTSTGSGSHPDMGDVVFTDPLSINVTACRRDCANAGTSCRSECAQFLDSCMSNVGKPNEPLAPQCNEAAARCRLNCATDLNACNTNCNRPREGCPFVLANDGGTFINTLTQTPACQTPRWIESEVTIRSLWLWTLSGANIPNSRIREALYMGAQDNGPFATLDAGAATPNWLHRGNGDAFDTAADSRQVVFNNCCSGAPRDNRVFLRNPGQIGGGEIPNYPPGLLRFFLFPDLIARFGANRYAMATTSGIFATQDVRRNPIAWTRLGTNAPPNACGLWAAGSQNNVTFFAVTGFCSGFFGDLLRYKGTSATQTWQKVPLPSGSFGVGVFAVDPNNPNRLFVSAFNSTGQNIFRSFNGGLTWTADPLLDSLMTGGGAFQLTVTNAGSVSYTQPTLVAFDPDNSNTLLAGAADAGIFLSRDNGASWTTVTNNSGDASNPIVPRPYWAYFDRECSQNNIYVGTQGRGAWRLTYRDPEGITVSVCQAGCDSAVPECQSRCFKLFEECMAETGPGKPLPSQCASTRETCRISCDDTRDKCRQLCVDCPQ